MKIKKGRWFSIIFLLGFSFWLSCSSAEKEVHRAIYHWQTQLELSKLEDDFLGKAEISKLYVRFFDVDKLTSASEILPQAEIICKDSLPNHLEIIPTIFLTNRSFREITPPALDSLVERVLRKTKYLWKQFPDHSWRELQLDCDWSGQTREAYFQFLDKIKERLYQQDIQLSVTIRLHQLKYPRKTGVPPADRGMLMFYNMGDLENKETSNSILDTMIAQQYITPSSGNYPLALDIALPIFSWGVLFREDRMIKLINNLQATRLDGDARFDKIGENQYQVRQSTYLDAYYLYKGDQIRCEKVKYTELLKSATLLRSITKQNSFAVSYYHLDTATLKNYSHEELETLYQYFEDPDL